jgi:hypothetical protein
VIIYYIKEINKLDNLPSSIALAPLQFIKLLHRFSKFIFIIDPSAFWKDLSSFTVKEYLHSLDYFFTTTIWIIFNLFRLANSSSSSFR